MSSIQHPASSTQSGFALLVAIVFMSVMLALGLALGSFAYKQQRLAASALESQYAFYAADAALECALYADQQQNLFAYPGSSPSSAPGIICDNLGPVSASVVSYTASQWVVANRLSLSGGTRCADVTVYKPASVGTTYLFSQGYNISCTAVTEPSSHFSSRGLQAQY